MTRIYAAAATIEHPAPAVNFRCGRCNETYPGASTAGRGKNGGKLCKLCANADAAVAHSYRLRKLRGGGYAVFNAAGERVSPVYMSEGLAFAWMERREAGRQPGKRPCLRCGKPFDSRSPVHRLCDPCRNFARDACHD